jgi:hypothetical protein
MFWRLVDSRELNRLPGDLIAVAAVRHTLDPDQYETPQPTLTLSLSIVRTGRVELCQQEHYVPNAMARGPLRVPSVVALAVRPSQASSSVSASSATEPPDAAATFAAARQKLNRKRFND